MRHESLTTTIYVQLAVATTTVVRTMSVVWERRRVNNNKASYVWSARLHCGDRGKEPSGPRCRHALRGSNSKDAKESRKRGIELTSQFQNMQMRMNDNQSRNLPSQTDSRDSGSSASIAFLRKFMPMT
eukprot:6214088-Pleurochrysis_carterae.AAC.1